MAQYPPPQYPAATGYMAPPMGAPPVAMGAPVMSDPGMGHLMGPGIPIEPQSPIKASRGEAQQYMESTGMPKGICDQFLESAQHAPLRYAARP